jgi:hypothetical protein
MRIAGKDLRCKVSPVSPRLEGQNSAMGWSLCGRDNSDRTWCKFYFMIVPPNLREICALFIKSRALRLRQLQQG